MAVLLVALTEGVVSKVFAVAVMVLLAESVSTLYRRLSASATMVPLLNLLKIGYEDGFKVNELTLQMYFSLPMYTQESLKLLVTLKSGLVDVYVKHQQIPTLTSYTMVGQISHLGVTTVNITDLQLGTW